jgi:putative endonuclease
MREAVPMKPIAPDLSKRARGRWGEDRACTHYRRLGYQIVERNWRCEQGEIDVVARLGNTIVFCEVKTRRSDAFGTPAEAVTPRKQRRLRGLAVEWLAERGVRGELRFDVASVRPAGGRGGFTVEVLEAAF